MMRRCRALLSPSSASLTVLLTASLRPSHRRPYNLVRICDNLASLDNDSFIAWAKTATSLGDGDYAVFASFAQAAFDLKSVNARVYPTYELYDLVKHPLFHSNFHVGGLYSGNVTGFSSSDTKKILASGNVAIDLVTEAFWSNISCEDVSSTASFSSSLASGDRLTSYNISFPCATRQVAYLRSSTLFDVTYDAFACDNGDPKMYVWGVNTSSGALPAMYECTLNSATSVDADVRIKVSKVSTGVVKVEPQQRDITSLPLVPYLGEFLLNRYGSTGWEELSRWMQDDILPFEYIPLTPDEKVDFLSTLLSVEMAIALASFSGGLLNTDTADWAVSERVFREVRFPFFSSLPLPSLEILPRLRRFQHSFSTNSTSSASTSSASNTPGSWSPPSSSFSSSTSPTSSSRTTMTARSTLPTRLARRCSAWVRRRMRAWGRSRVDMRGGRGGGRLG